jgi:predicted aspartyl protease
MLKLLLRNTTLAVLSSCFALSSLACSQGSTETSTSATALPPSPSASVSPSSPPRAVKTTTTSTPSGRDPYAEAIDFASSAINFSKSAMVKEDWVMVASRWQEAVQYLQTVPKSHQKYQEARAKLPQYKRFLAEAQLKAKPTEKPKADASGDVNPKFFLVPIKRRVGGIPIVTVNFNGRQFDMLFDTGASGTLISGAIAATLNLKPVSTTTVVIADGSAVELPVVVVESMEINGRIKRKISATIAPNMPIGLLGQDFFEGYDFMIKENAIEFHRQ